MSREIIIDKNKEAFNGRFISRDPIDISDDINLYAYVGNNSVMFVDRMGESKSSIKSYNLGTIYNIAVFLENTLGDTGSFLGLNITGIGGTAANLDVSSYMLSKFMYGNGSTDYYGNNNWISQKLKKTDFYNNQLNKALNIVRKKGVYKKDSTGDLTGGLFTDFPTSFGTVNWTMSAKRNTNGQIETTFNIVDTYVFNDFYSDGITPIDNPLNVLAKYYQDRGYGTPFKWELNITDTFNY